MASDTRLDVVSRDSICTPTGCRAVLEDDPKATPAREVPPVETLKDATVSYPAEMQGPGKWFPLVCPKCEWRGLSRDSICLPTGGDDYDDPECPRCRTVLVDDPKAASPAVDDERERALRPFAEHDADIRYMFNALDTARAERDRLVVGNLEAQHRAATENSRLRAELARLRGERERLLEVARKIWPLAAWCHAVRDGGSGFKPLPKVTEADFDECAQLIAAAESKEGV